MCGAGTPAREWVAAGGTHTVTNVGKKSAKFVTLEFH